MYGCRPVAVTGSFVMCTGLGLCAVVTEVYQLYICFSVVTGDNKKTFYFNLYHCNVLTRKVTR